MRYQNRLIRERDAAALQAALSSSKWIDPELPHNTKERQRGSYLCKMFAVTRLGKARLTLS